MDIKCILVSDFEKVCRICMKFDKALLSTCSFNITDMIIAFASVQIWENDDLPNQICNACFLQLQNTINFKQLCESSDKAFRQIIENNKNNLWNNQNDLDNVKNEEFDSLDYGHDSSPVYIKEEGVHDNVTNQNDYGKSETNHIEDEEMLEIENENRLEINKRETRRKTIQFKFEEESDNSEDIIGEKDSDWEGEDEESDLEEQPQINEEYKCEVCSGTFKRVDVLGVHMHRKHNAEGTKCKKCSLICYHALHLRAHEMSHNKCNICNLSFSSRKKLEIHRINHNNEDIPEITCKICGKKLTCKTNLNRHMKDVHNVETKKKYNKCDACDETFKTKRLLEKHNRKMHPKAKKINKQKEIVNCEVCGKSLKRRHLSVHMKIHGERVRTACEYCPKIFISEGTLKTHVKTYHKGSGPVYKCLCTVCGLKLRSKADLKKHSLTHTNERPFACDKCDKTSRTAYNLKQHILRVHLNQRNFVCTFCSQAFFDKKILLNHVRRHTGEKPFKCNICDKRFIQKVALRGHMKVHTDSIPNL